MIITPDNEAYLLKAPIHVDEMHQLDFANLTTQTTYFQSLPKLALMKITYQRENGTLFVPFNIEQVRSYNYVMYKNKNYSNKWFYAFITDIHYESNNVTSISIKTDVYQTYMFDYSWKNSFVERETVEDDTFGKNVYPENIEYGDYICNAVVESNPVGFIDSNATNCLVCVYTSEAIGELTSGTEATVINSIPTGVHAYLFSAMPSGVTPSLSDFYFLKGWLDGIGKGDAILALFIIPNNLVGTSGATINLYDVDGNTSGTTLSVLVPNNKYGVYDIAGDLTVTKPSTIDGYTPKNQKCFIAPYNYFYISNNIGSAVNFNYEDFYSTPTFKQIGIFSLGGEYALMPRNSKKSQQNNTAPLTDLKGWNEMIGGGSFPVLAWESDYYLNWCASNKSKQEADLDYTVASGQAKMITSALEAGIAGKPVTGLITSVAEGVNTAFDAQDMIEQQDIERKNADRVPNTIKGNYGKGDMAFSAKKYCFTAYKMTIRNDAVKRIDSYFSKFGYRVNEHKIPNLKSRTNWNYIKTVGANLSGDIPQEALIELKSIFNTGLTIWHNPTTFLDYSQNNTIIR